MLAKVAAVVVAILIVLPFVLGVFVAGTIRTVAPQILGVPVKVNWVSLSFLRGRVGVHGFEIGNPEGFNTPYLLHAGKVVVDLHVPDLLHGKTHIEKLHVIGPHVWYHRKLTESNLSVLLDGLDKRFPKNEKEEDDSKDKKKEKKPVVIDHFLFDEGTVGVKFGAGVEVPLAKVELFDLGKDGAFMPGQIVVILVKSIFSSVVSLVTNVGGAAVDTVGDVGKAAVGGVVSAAKGIGSLFGGSSDTNAPAEAPAAAAE